MGDMPFLNHPSSTRRRGWGRPTWRIRPAVIAVVAAAAAGWFFRGIGL